MRLKSAYREKPVEAPNIPEPSEKIDVEVQADPEAIVAAAEPSQPVDEATQALMQQLAHLRASEQAQREFATQVAAQRAAQMAAPAPTLPAGRAERIALWRQHGLADDDAAYLEAHPDMIDHPRVTQQAVAAAERSGLQRGSDDFNNAVENNFNTLMGRAEAQATPAFFEPPEATRSPAAPDRAAMYSAPVSRQAPSTGYREPSPRSVRLTSEEAAMAAASGISETEYARQKLRLLKAKASGELQ